MTQYADFTYLSTLLRCPLQHHFRYRMGLEPIEGGRSVPMLAGSLGHAALELFYRGEPFIEPIGELYASSGIVAIGTFDYMTQGHLEVVMHNYAERYSEDSILRVTQFIEQPLVSERLQLGGIPDMIVKYEGELAVWDHKWTTGWLGNLESRLELSAQLPIYCILASEHLGQPVRKAVLNMVHMGPGASNPKSKAERFARKTYTHTDWQLEEAERWVRETQLLDNYFFGLSGLPPHNADTHCSWCSFKDLCHARSATVRDAMIATGFKKRNITGTLLSGADMEEG